MNSLTSWGLAIAALAVGYYNYGWQGFVLAASVVTFWLLLQFSRIMRIMTTAGKSPIGHIPDARSLNLRLKRGLPLVEVLKITRSLGELKAQMPETFRWTDDNGDFVEIVFRGGRADSWVFERQDEPGQAGHAASSDVAPPAAL